jgi:hypothetical protein
MAAKLGSDRYAMNAEPLGKISYPRPLPVRMRQLIDLCLGQTVLMLPRTPRALRWPPRRTLPRYQFLGLILQHLDTTMTCRTPITNFLPTVVWLLLLVPSFPQVIVPLLSTTTTLLLVGVCPA